jgi:multidrug transporter EmrE-like cation transporter
MQTILAIVGIEAIGDWSFTKYIQKGRIYLPYKLIGYICYIGVLELFQKSIMIKGLAWTNSAWDGWSNIATGLVALLIFKEKPSLKEFCGIALVSLGLFLLGTEGIANYQNKQ